MQIMLRPTERLDTPLSGEIKIRRYNPEYIDDIWPMVTPWLQGSLAVAPPWWTLGDLYTRCLAGDYALWMVYSDEESCGVALSELCQFNAHLVCGVPWICGHNMQQWLPSLQEVIEQWGRDASASFLAGSGRKGWMRASGMKDYGFILAKEL